MDVGAAEPVDRLLRIADRDEVAVEDGGESTPLHGVGVLELVDHHQLVAAAQCGHGRRARDGMMHRVVQACDELVVPHLLTSPLPFVHQRDGAVHEVHPRAQPLRTVVGMGLRRAQHRHQPHTAIAQHCAHGLLELCEHGRRRHQSLAIAPAQCSDVTVQCLHHQIAAHLFDVLGLVRTEFGVDRVPRTKAELPQCDLAEAMDGGDGGFVERADGGVDPAATFGDLVVAAVEQHVHPSVFSDHHALVQRVRRRHQYPPSAVAQFGGSCAGERDQQQLRHLPVPLGDVTHHECAERVRLPRARTGLDDEPACVQFAGEVEG